MNDDEQIVTELVAADHGPLSRSTGSTPPVVSS